MRVRGGTGAGSFRGPTVARGELERNVAREDVDVDDPHEIDPVDLLHFHEHGDRQEGEGDEQEVDDGRLRRNHGGAAEIRMLSQVQYVKDIIIIPFAGWFLKKAF